ncbi:MAG: N-6 DNA methylase [Thermodesulfovibrionales bacterium]|jgi:type I restriction-modification system DNA methylase subunit
MSEELLQRDLLGNPEKLGKWNFYNIGATSLRALKEYKIIPDIDYRKFEKRKPDGLIACNKKVIAVISNKLPKRLKTKKQIDAEVKDWIEVTKKLKSSLLIITDTQKTIWINALMGEAIRDENNNDLMQVFNPKDIETVKLIEKILDSIDAKNSQLIALKLKDPSPLAKQIWQDIWSVSGATPENCLYTFVELFIFKYLSDLNVLTGFYNFYELLKKYETNNEEEVLEFYADVIRKEIKNKFKESPRDKTTIINGTIFVSKDEKAVKGYSAVFKKVLEKFNNEGKLENIHHEFKSKIFESFLKESISKKNWGQFFTPLKVVRAIAQMTDIHEGMSICDPACGVGKFLLEPILKDLHRFYKIDKNRNLIRKINLIGFDKGFDKDEQKTIILAKANMLIYLSDLIKENPDITDQFSDLFNDTFLLKTNSILGSLSEPITNEYDLILTNPPYVTSGSSNIKEEIRKSGLESHYVINALGVEGLFMEWIIRALKPGGKAFVVIPDGILNRSNDKNLRKFILDECFLDAIISLPVKTFFTTIKKTYILAITKKIDKSIIQKEAVFTYLVSDIGETLDVYRFDTGANHLEDAAILFRQFIATKKHFKTDDKRCKTFDFDKFYQNIERGWVFDRWWTEEEKRALGLLEENKSLSINDFAILLGDIANEILTYQEELKELQKEKKKIGHDLTLYDLKEVPIEQIFDLTIKTNHSKFTKEYIDKHKGTIPVYSASKDPRLVDYGCVTDNLTGIKYFEDCLTWNIDGSIGKAHYRKGRFSLSEKVIPLIVFPQHEKQLDLNYLKYEIENEFSKYSFNFGNKAGKGKIKNIKIKIPINKKGEFDLKAQKEITKKYQIIEQVKQELENKLNDLLKINIDI